MSEKQVTDGMIGGNEGEEIPTDGILGAPAVAIPDPTPSVSNMMKEGEEMLHDVRTVNLTVAIVIERNGVTQNTIGTPGKTPFKWVNDMNRTVRFESRDYIINVNDYRFNNVAVKPLKGDIITETVAGIKYTYEVLPFNKEPVWLYSGQYRTAIRVRTKQIDKELA